MSRRLVIALLGLAACGDDGSSIKPGTTTFDFGPYPLAAGQEINRQCVSATLHNDQPLYVNQIELTTGPGFHHSNWFWIDDTSYVGEDGTWDCTERNYDEADVGFRGGVLYAQSTQATHEVQKFPDGIAIVIPPHARIVAGTHLLNQGDEPLTVPLSLSITTIADPTTKLAGMGFTNQSLTLPAMRDSRMTQLCDIGAPYQNVLSKPLDFSIYYAVAHYHELGTGLTLEAVRADGSSEMIFETVSAIGDVLGGPISPPFSLAGFQKIRYSCHYTNPRTTSVKWGVGESEMCAFLAFTDADVSFSGGALTYNTVPTVVDQGSYVENTYDCLAILSEAHL